MILYNHILITDNLCSCCQGKYQFSIHCFACVTLVSLQTRNDAGWRNVYRVLRSWDGVSVQWPPYVWMCGDYHDDIIKWKHFRRYRPRVREIQWSLVNTAHKGQGRGALIFSLIYTWTNAWVRNQDAGGLKHHHAHYHISIMTCNSWYTYVCVRFIWNIRTLKWEVLDYLNLIFHHSSFST